MNTTPPLFVLKRQAKALAKQEHIPHLAALDRIAQEHGFERWSLLTSSTTQSNACSHVLRQLLPGDLMLLGARPGHGKTLMGLELLAKAIRQGQHGWFFTLEYNLSDVLDRLHLVDGNPAELTERLAVDNSDDISAAYIIHALQHAPPNSVIVIDYLQLLDQKRQNAPLQQQVEALKRFAVDKDLVVVLISQIDRCVELSNSTFPTIEDVRLPNPLDLTLFDKTLFLNQRAVNFSTKP